MTAAFREERKIKQEFDPDLENSSNKTKDDSLLAMVLEVGDLS
jgi:hypothetical protein